MREEEEGVGMRLLGGLVLLVAGVVAEQHILLDSTKESMLDWFKYPKGPQSPTPGQLRWCYSLSFFVCVLNIEFI